VTRRRLIGVFAHPDDESLLAGGLLAACSDAGLDPVVVCATRGEAGPSAGVNSRPELAATRAAELRRACDALGVADLHILDHPDGMISERSHEVTKELAELFAAAPPAAVVTFDAVGLYHHPDHVAVHDAVVRAVASQGSHVRLYFATLPAGLLAEVVAAASEDAGDLHTWGIDPNAFGIPPAEITTVLDVRRYLARKLRALRSHESQLDDRNVFRSLRPDLAERLLGHEHFVAAGGTDGWLAATFETRPAAPVVDPRTEP
jgi:LmbE family N-acetylglucosaminyl deacetylase